MIETARKNARLILEIMLSILVLALLVSFLNRNRLKMDVRLIFQARVEHNDAFELDLDGRRIKARIIQNRNFQDIVFKLPKTDISKIRLHLGHQANSVQMRRVTIKTLFNAYSWPAESFRQIFNFKNHIRKDYVRNGSYHLLIDGKDPYLGISRTISTIINRLARRKWFFYLLAFFSACLFFWFLRVLSFRNLRLFFDRRVLENLVLIFLFLIYLPLVNSILPMVKPQAIQERRQLAGGPEFRFDALSDFLSEYRKYYDDHFVLRNLLIKTNSLLHFILFRRSATPLVTVGKGGWLFMAEETPQRNETDYFRSVSLFGREELENWTRILEARRTWLSARGIEYLFVVVPNKSTIYPEFMPDYIHRVRKVSRLDQLMDSLSLHSKVKILDLRPSLLAAREVYPVYYKTDSHWNDFGAYTAYREIIRYIHDFYADEKPMPLSDFEIRRLNRAGGDLAQTMALEKNLLRENSVEMIPEIPFYARTVSRVNLSAYVTKSISRCRTGKLPGAMVVHDSFIHELRPFLAQHFSSMVFIWDWGLNIYPEIIRRQKPWLVIEEMAERYLLDKILSNPPEISLPDSETD
jgi:hypothetical protein